MHSNRMAMTRMMRAKMRVVMTMSMNLKPNASHVCLLWAKRKLAQSGVQQRRQPLMCWYLGAASGSKQPGNRTMAVRGALSGPKGRFVGLTVGATNWSKVMGFVRLTVGASDASMQVGVKRVLKAQLLIALLMVVESVVSMQLGVTRVLEAQVHIAVLTAGASDVSMHVGVKIVPKVQLLIALLTVGASDASMQVGVERVPKVQLLIAMLTAGASVVSMRVVATSMW
jgi:hypothetical protein